MLVVIAFCPDNGLDALMDVATEDGARLVLWSWRVSPLFIDREGLSTAEVASRTSANCRSVIDRLDVCMRGRARWLAAT